MKLFKHPTHGLLAGCLWLVATNLAAAPLTFSQSEYTAFATAELDANINGPFALSSAPGSLPLIANASLSTLPNSSFAVGIANMGQLVASTQAFSLGASSAGVAGAGFSGQFIGTGQAVNFGVDFSSFNNVVNGAANSQLFITLVSDGTTLFDKILSSSQTVNESYLLSQGSTNLFDIQLISNANALGGLDAALGFNLASAAFNVSAVPEPNVAWLMLAGMGMVGLVRRKATRAAIG